MRGGAAALALAALLAAAPGTPLHAEPDPPYRIQADNMTGGRGPEGDVLFLNGNLVVKRGRTTLTADNGRYMRTNGMIFLMGHVRLVDSTVTVTCEQASFNENDDRLDLQGNVVIQDGEATLRAPAGTWDRGTGVARLVGGVTGQDRKQRLSSDEATYDRGAGRIRASGRVKGQDDENRLELDAGDVDYDRGTRVAIATGDPVLRQRDEDGRVSVLRALRLRVDSARKTAEAIDSVRVERDTLRASGQYAFFDDSTGRGVLLGNPRAWDDETTVTGDTLETWSEQRKLKKVVVLGRARMDYLGLGDTSAGETSRMTGNRIEVFLTEDRIDSLIALGEAKNSYSAAERTGKTAETNSAQGDTIRVLFKGKKIDRARVTGGAHGEYRPPVAVEDSTAIAAEVIRYEGKVIEFVVPKNRIVLEGDAHLTYREMELNSRRVIFDSERQTLVAEGKPQLVDKGDKLDGHLMSYDLETRTGTVYGAQTAYEKGLYHGSQIRKVGDDELHVLDGRYSTCDLDQPHYHFSARWMKIYLKDKLVAKPVVFYLRNVPILALPFYVFPIKPGRHSGFLFPQFEFGFSDRTGQFIRNAGYYWAPNDYLDLSAAVDYYQAQPSYLTRIESNYKLLYRFDGRIDFRFQRDQSTQRDDYVFQSSHVQEVTPRTRLVARGDFVSSRDFSGDPFSGGTLAQRLNRFLTSTLTVTHAADWASFNVTMDRRQDLDAAVSLQDPDGTGPLQGPRPGTQASLPSLTQSEPRLSVSFPTRTLGSTAFLKDTRVGNALKSTYITMSARFSSARTERSFVDQYRYFLNADSLTDSTTVLGTRNTLRRGFASNLSVSDSRRLFGWLNFAPSLSAQAVVFDFDETGRTIVPAGVFSSGAGMGTSFFRSLRTPVTPLALRHVISPSLSVQYAPEFRGLQYTDSLGVSRNRFNPFSDISISGFEVGRLSFGLDQRLQAKWTDGDKVTRLDNLLALSSAGSYNLLWRKQGQTRGLSPISNVLRIQPPGYLSGDINAVVDPLLGRPLRSLGTSVGFNIASGGGRAGQQAQLATDATRPAGTVAPEEEFRDSWRFSSALSHTGGYSGPSWRTQTAINASLSYQLTRNWRFDYSTYYDLTIGEPVAQTLNITRRIHCWDASFTRSFAPGSGAEYYFRLGITDQREVYYERGSRVQSFGGIQ